MIAGDLDGRQVTAGSMSVPSDAGGRGLSLEGITKVFGDTMALNAVDLTLKVGEVLGLVGQNGSGKSTLIKVLAGVHTPDTGRLLANGQPVPLPLKDGAARRMGLAFVHQDLALLPNLTVTENLLMDELATIRNTPIQWRHRTAEAASLLRSYDLDIDPRELVSTLSALEKAQLAIARAASMVERGSESGDVFLILDEPTVFLPRAQRDELLGLMRRLAANGGAALLVSHDLQDVLKVSDRVTVLRDGRVIGTIPSAEASEDHIIEMMIGQAGAQTLAPNRGHANGSTPRRVLAVAGATGGPVRNFSMEAHAGEVIGLTGLAGAGFDKAPYLLYGAAKAEAGELEIDGKLKPLVFVTPGTSIKEGVVLIPGARLRDGLLARLPAAENIAMPVLNRFFRRGYFRTKSLGDHFNGLATTFDVRGVVADKPVSAYSGGNQQKILLAKWVQIQPKVVLADEPTQGVDVGARREILENLAAMAADLGTVIIIASIDYAELASICHRVLVFAEGTVVREMAGAEISEESIAEACLRSRGACPQPTMSEGAGIS